MHRIRRLSSLPVVVALVACSTKAADEAPRNDSAWNTFWSAARDYAAGPPTAKALGERRHFEQAGIAFDYPAPLRMAVGNDGDKWTLTYGDFDLELHAPKVEMGSGDYIGLLADVLDSERARVEALAGMAVTWCGQEIKPVHMRFTMFGDRHDMRGYDMPAPDGEARFIVFDDVLVDGKSSAVSEAAFALLASTIQCKANAKSAQESESAEAAE